MTNYDRIIKHLEETNKEINRSKRHAIIYIIFLIIIIIVYSFIEVKYIG